MAAALREVRLISPEQVEKYRKLQQDHPDGIEVHAMRSPFRLDALRSFLTERRPAYEASLRAMRSRIDIPTLAAFAEELGFSPNELITKIGMVNSATDKDAFEIPTWLNATLLRAVSRLRRIRAMGFPEVIVEHELDSARRVLNADWLLPTVEFDAAIPDEIYPVAIIDREAYMQRDSRLPLLGADISDLVLLAAQCCVAPDARALDGEEFAALTWQKVGRPDALDGDVGELPEGFVAVRPNLCSEQLERFEFTLLDDTLPVRALASGGALLTVALNESEGDSDEDDGDEETE